jgi:cysteine desulfurase family protein
MIYLDHAATSWPKPTGVMEAMAACLNDYGANPGRGSHAMASRASQEIQQARLRLAKLFKVRDPRNIIFTSNTTEALNLGLKGFLKPGDHVITTSIEHNSIRRPLEYLKKRRGIEVTYLENETDGSLQIEKFKAAIKTNTVLVAISHASNLLGTLQPVKEIGEYLKGTNIRLLVDAAQTAGIIPIDVSEMNVHMLALPGHKGLMGPQGTGALYIDPNIELEPLVHGGTGSFSEQVDQPKERPYRYESGTPNTVGIAGWNAALAFIEKVGVDTIFEHEKKLLAQLYNGLMDIQGIITYGHADIAQRVGVVPFNVTGYDPNEVSMVLDMQYGIAVRSGYHCTPLAHGTAGTSTYGAVRASIGYATTEKDIGVFLMAIQEIASAVRQE